MALSDIQKRELVSFSKEDMFHMMKSLIDDARSCERRGYLWRTPRQDNGTITWGSMDVMRQWVEHIENSDL